MRTLYVLIAGWPERSTEKILFVVNSEVKNESCTMGAPINGPH